MRNGKLVTLALSATALAGAAVVAPSASADTVSTFSLTGAAATVTLSVPTGDDTTPVDLGSSEAGGLLHQGQLGAVTVTDERAALVSSWTVNVSSTAFDLVGGDPTQATQTVPVASIGYSSGLPTVSGPGIGTFTPLLRPSLAAVGTPGTWAGSGSKTASWDPTLSFTLLAGQIAGTYKGTVTHSVTVTS